MNIFGVSKDSRIQLIFWSDNTFEFRRLPVQDGSVVQKKGEEVQAGWPILNKLVMSFSGGMGLKRCKVLISSAQDIVFDLFDAVPDSDKPEKGDGLVKDWIKRKAETIRYRHQAKPKVSTIMNWVVASLGATLVLLGIGLFITIMRGVYD